MVESVGAGNDFEERVKGSFRVHLSQEPSQKNPPFSYTRGGWTSQWEGRDRASGVLDVIVKVIEVAFLSRKFKWPTLMRGWRGK